MTELLFLLLPIAAASGWYAAKRTPSSKHYASPLSQDYLVGLNYLLNEEPDKAVDIFVKMLEVNSETVETHLALGVLFRRRGEIDRAIRIHQNLIARPQLPPTQRIEALLALGQDYLRAGMFDRAERLLLEVIENNNPYVSLASHSLLDVYQQQKRWEEAINIARKLFAKGEEMQSSIANYFCELAIQASAQNQSDQVRHYLKHAIATDKNCVRASLLLGDLETKMGNYKAALAAYDHVKQQDSSYLSEIIPAVVDCYRLLEDKAGLIHYLQENLKLYPKISLVLVIADYLNQHEGNHAAIEFIVTQLQRQPSLRGLQRLIALQLEIVEEKTHKNLLLLKELIANLLKNKPIYRCLNCGFSSKLLHWLCPTCRRWNMVKPIQGVEGE